MGSVPEPHNKATVTTKLSPEFFVSQHIKVVFAQYSVKCAVAYPEKTMYIP